MGARTLLPLAAAVLAAAAVAVLVLGLLAGGEVVLGEPVLVGDVGVITVNNSPAAARNPQNADNVVVVNRVDRPNFSAAISASSDGGGRFTTSAPPLPDGLDRPYAPSVAFTPDGRAHVLYVNLTGTGNVPDNLWLTTSTDGGTTFDLPVRVAGALTFQGRLAVDPAAGTLYATWLQADEVGLLAFPGSPRIVAARSTDGGATWSEPVEVSDPDRPRVGAAVPVVDPDGNLVVVYKDFKDDVRDWQNLEGPVWEEPFALVVTRSTDGGQSFEAGRQIDGELLPYERFLPFLPAFPSLAAGPGGELYVAWDDARNGDPDVFLRRSPDGGSTWSEPVRVNDNPAGDGTTQQLPAVDVAPGGRVDVLYLDRRADPEDVLTEASLASSSDGGATFRRVVVSPQPFDARIGASAAPHLPVDLGSRQAVLSGPDGALVAWTDSAQGTEATGRQDVVVRSAAVGGAGMPLATRAVVAGALLLAAVVLFAWWRRPRGESAPAG